MENRIATPFLSGAAALMASSLLLGCAGGKTAAQQAGQAAVSSAGTAATGAASEQLAAPAAEATRAMEPGTDKPGAAEGELIVVTAKVKAVDKKNRAVTLQYPDGRQIKVKCGPEVRNFPQIRVGDDVTARFLETVELFVTAPQGKPTAKTSEILERAPLGSKPGAIAIETMEVSATVDSIDYQSRQVKLKGPEGKVYTVKAGPEVKRFNEIKQGDTVVARLTEAVSIQVSAPK